MVMMLSIQSPKEDSNSTTLLEVKEIASTTPSTVSETSMSLFPIIVRVSCDYLEGAYNIQILGGQDIVHAVLDGQFVLQTGTGGFRLLDADFGFGKAATAFSTRVFGLETLLGEFRVGGMMEKLR